MAEFITEGPGVPPAAGPYSAGVVSGDLCFLSGQIALDPDGAGLVGATTAEQIRQALRNLFAVAAAGGFAANEVVLINVLLTDVGDFPVVNDAYAAELPDGHRPARMTFQAAALPLGAKVEVQGFARHA
ncbi:MAG: hypothetical protein BGO11_09550 [Solirubrobacterales bacterium 70-9]|mgnify:CR=1 FL=1|nr:MAG: hypothetical protein BGO11_09550 [Solirubrobacterales bacterium 70-9]